MVGTHSISPNTNTITATTTIGSASEKPKTRNGRPISISAATIRAAGANRVAAFVTRSCSSATSSGFTIAITPHSDRLMPWCCTTEIGSSSSNPT